MLFHRVASGTAGAGIRKGPPTRLQGAAVVLTVFAWGAFAPLGAQTISGRVIDSENGSGVGLAAVIVLDSERTPLLMRAADTAGVFTVDFPAPGEYVLVIDRLGYFETESPLLAVAANRTYVVDFEMRPEPIRLDPLEVTVANEKLEDFLSLELGVHPASLSGYRAIQGLRLEEAKLKATDNTDLLRWLYIPVTHGSRVCVGTFGAPLPARMYYERTMARAEESATVDPEGQCGALYVDGIRCRNEFLEDIDMDRIAVVVTVGGAVHLYTRAFDWTFKPGYDSGAC